MKHLIEITEENIESEIRGYSGESDCIPNAIKKQTPFTNIWHGYTDSEIDGTTFKVSQELEDWQKNLLVAGTESPINIIIDTEKKLIHIEGEFA